MQTIKEIVSVLVRLIMVDGLIVILSWIEGVAFHLRSVLQKFAINIKKDKISSFKDVQKQLDEMNTQFCEIHTGHKNVFKREVAEVHALIDKIKTDFYEEVPEDEVENNGINTENITSIM